MAQEEFNDNAKTIVRFVLVLVLLVIFFCFFMQSQEFVKLQLREESFIPSEFKYTRNILLAILIINVLSHIIGALNHLMGQEYLYLAFFCWNFYCLIFILWLIFQYLRLYYSFRTSIFNLSKCVRYWVYFQLGAMIILYCLSIILIIGYLITPESNWPVRESLTIHFWNVVWVMLGISVVFSLNITVSFALKLWKLALMRNSIAPYSYNYNYNSGNNNTSSNNYDPSSNSNDNHETGSTRRNSRNSRNSNMSSRNSGKSVITEQQFQLLDLSAKQTLLNASQTMLFFYYTFWFYISRYVTFKNMSIINLTGDFICWTLWSLCLWLTFAFANKEYRIVCKYGHKCCLKCFTTLAERIVIKALMPPHAMRHVANGKMYQLMKPINENH